MMIFGHNNKYKNTFKYNNLAIEKVSQYKYLGVIIKKTGKIKYCIEDRILKASRAISMVQGALTTSGNISVKTSLSIFDKQIIPKLMYENNNLVLICFQPRRTKFKIIKKKPKKKNLLNKL